VTPHLAGFVARRALTGLLLVIVASSAALVLARLVPGDHIGLFDVPPEVAETERRRLGLDRPIREQYLEWVRTAARLDLGESTRYPGRRVSALIGERAGNSILLGTLALGLATLLGIPLGVVTGSRMGRAAVRAAQGSSLLILSIPPIVLALALLVFAARTGLFPVGGLPGGRSALEAARYFVLPVIALALPAAAVLERLQSRSLAYALGETAIVAGRARGLPARRVVWRHAFRLSLGPVLSVYGILIGGLFSGSFVVEYVMTWPGLGRLMYDALMYRDANLVAGCAATGAALLACGVFLSDVARAVADPRLEERR